MTQPRREPHTAPRKQMARVQEARLLTATLETVDERGYSNLTVAQITLSLSLSQNRVQNLSFPGPLGPRIPGPVGQIPSSFFPCSHGVHDLVLSITDQRVSCTPP